jgi:hypothetical protein
MSAASATFADPVPGRSSPLGASVGPGGVNCGANFSVYSRSASAVDLLLFNRDEDAQPSRVIPIDPVENRTYHYWHAFVPGPRQGQLYGYRVHGPADPATGLWFDPGNVLPDPYGRGVAVPAGYSRDAARLPGDNASAVMKSLAIDSAGYDWDGDRPLCHPSTRTIIYEMHVRGFTQHPNSGLSTKTRGTYAGLIEKIPYLQQLGINAVELLPVFQFDARDAPRTLRHRSNVRRIPRSACLWRGAVVAPGQQSAKRRIESFRHCQMGGNRVAERTTEHPLGLPIRQGFEIETESRTRAAQQPQCAALISHAAHVTARIRCEGHRLSVQRQNVSPPSYPARFVLIGLNFPVTSPGKLLICLVRPE